MHTSWWPLDVTRRNKVPARGTSAEFPAILRNRIAEWLERGRSRYLLQQLDDRMLRDIGLSRSEVDQECAKYFWRH
jgi:uncharacterized protein YjiS (DUF1127 family)